VFSIFCDFIIGQKYCYCLTKFFTETNWLLGIDEMKKNRLNQKTPKETFPLGLLIIYP
jgi:hypothetical protein